MASRSQMSSGALRYPDFAPRRIARQRLVQPKLRRVTDHSRLPLQLLALRSNTWNVDVSREGIPRENATIKEAVKQLLRGEPSLECILHSLSADAVGHLADIGRVRSVEVDRIAPVHHQAAARGGGLLTAAFNDEGSSTAGDGVLSTCLAYLRTRQASRRADGQRAGTESAGGLTPLSRQGPPRSMHHEQKQCALPLLSRCREVQSAPRRKSRTSVAQSRKRKNHAISSGSWCDAGRACSQWRPS